MNRWFRWFLGFLLGLAIANPFSPNPPSTPAAEPPPAAPAPNPSKFQLPSARPHPLPDSLARWTDPGQAGDYFDQVKPVGVGYLVWSEFPVKVYIQPVTSAENRQPFTARQAAVWENAVEQAVQEWNRYLPLQRVEQPEGADIAVWRTPPPLRVERGDRSDSLSIRARSAETQFELYLKPLSSNSKAPGQDNKAASASPLLAHRFTILLRPDQAPVYLQAAARHELGHALGIWGHSSSQADALYFSQVRNPPPISARDVNTLRRIYQQPTRLGWQVTTTSPASH
jgi:predicted Zn-dependent protease